MNINKNANVNKTLHNVRYYLHCFYTPIDNVSY